MGVWGGCVVDTEPTRAFVYDEVAGSNESWTVEVKLASSFEGRLNFLVGGQYAEGERAGIYAVGNNLIDGFTVFRAPGFFPFPSLYSGMDFFPTRGEGESYSLFGEVYWKPTERVKVTVGLRYTEDKNRFNAVPGLGQSFRPPGDDSDPPGWIRLAFAPWVFSGQPDETGLALADFYGVTDEALAATGPGLIAVLQTVPPIPTFGELTPAGIMADFEAARRPE